MDTILNLTGQTQVFFFISSIGFVILSILFVIFLYYLISAMKSFSRMMNKIEDDVDNIGDTTKEMLSDVRDSAIFNFIFKKKSKTTQKKK
jgi:uncharacterized protein YoxC